MRGGIPKRNTKNNTWNNTKVDINTHTQMLYNIDTEGEIDRRQMIYMGIPTPDTTLANNLIKYKKK